MKNKRFYFSGLALLAALPSVYADEQQSIPIQEQTVTVASQIEVPLRELSASVSILDEADLQSLGYVDLGSALASMPSLSIANNGGLGQTTTLSLRGEPGFRTLVRVDGIDITDPSTPQGIAPLEHILTSGISRVEVLRGPHGLSYGADAGGVVNISTGRANEPGMQGRLSAERGSYATNNGHAQLAWSGETASISLMGSRLETDGFNANTADNMNPDDDGYENTTLHSRIALQPLDSLTIEGVFRDTEGQTEYDSCYNMDFAQVHACRSEHAQDSQRYTVNWQEFGEHSLAYTRNKIDRAYFAEGNPSFSAEGEIKKLAYKGSASPVNGHTLVYGFDDKKEGLPMETEDVERGQRGVFIEYLGSITDSLFVNLGARRDDNDDFGKHNSWRLGAAKIREVSESKELKFKLSYGTGFRAPSIYEEFINASSAGNPPELQEETSEGFDIGVELYSDEGLHLEMIYFEQKVENEIYYDFTFFDYRQGDGESDSSGLEMIAQVPLNARWSYKLNYTHTDSTLGDGTSRSRVPENSAALSLLGSLLDQRLQLALHLRANADIHDINSGADLDDYQVIDANIRYVFNDHLDLYLRLENLADEDYQSIAGYHTAEASAYAGVTLRF